ncbi:MAG: hypothetical protein ACRCZ0_09410 [Cetobacterium sp.]
MLVAEFILVIVIICVMASCCLAFSCYSVVLIMAVNSRRGLPALTITALMAFMCGYSVGVLVGYAMKLIKGMVM